MHPKITLTRKRYVGSCEICSKLFMHDGKGKYCSPECKARVAASKVVHERRHCRQCGKEFMSLRSNHIYCTRDCKKAAHRDRDCGEAQCPVCRQVFIRRSNKQRYCGTQCRIKAHNEKDWIDKQPM